MAKKTPFTHVFAVGSANGPRSSSWIVTIQDHDIYVAAWKLKESFKFSLHESGQWHLKELGSNWSSAPQLKSFDRDAKPETRTTGLCIVIPDDCLRPASIPWDQNRVDTWLDRPEPGGFVELIVGRVTGPANWDLVPSHMAMGFKMSATDMGGGWYGYVGHRALRPTDRVQQYRMLLEDIKRNSPPPVVLDSPERRGVFPTRTTQGHLMALEFAID